MNRPECIGRIEEALEAGVTPGPWMVTKGLNGPYAVICTETGPRIDIASTYSMPRENFTNAQLIAACNPSAMNELLAAYEGLEADAALASEQLTRAKNLLVKLWDKYPETRPLIEGHTGGWFVWGMDRDAAIAKEPKP